MNCCDNCERAIGKDDQIFTIPISKDWKWKEGTFCSSKCAVFANKNTFSIRRPAEEIEKRDKWLREKEQFNKNQKFK